MDWLFGVKYNIWVINTTSKVDLWLWENWKKLMPQVDALIKISKADPYIRTFQGYEFQNKWLGFGRMKWNEENNMKWTTKYRSNTSPDQELRFFSTEIWAPDWNYCCDKGKNPDIFINLYHHENIEKLREGILIAIPKKLANANLELIEHNITEIHKQIQDATLSAEQRIWTPTGKYPNRIEDMGPQELEELIYGKGSV